MTLPQMEPAVAPLARLLIVEDDTEIQAMLHALFSLANYDVEVVDSGKAALHQLNDHPIDLLVLDVMLPDMNGYEICTKVRASRNAQIPIVMLTALGQQAQVTQGLESGADDYMKKPFAPEELLLRVNRLLQRQEQVRSAEQELALLRDTLVLTQRQLTDARSETSVEATLRQEFVHNVTLHMQALVGIAEAAVRRVPPGPEREVLQQLRSRIQGAALVYETSAALQNDPVEIGHVLRSVASALKNMYRPWKRILLNVSGPPMELPLKLASPVAMIINELVTNCFKHGFPNNRFGKIDVEYAATPTEWTLHVSDDGVGFDVANTHSGKGGATIVHLLQQLSGRVTWESSSEGTRVHVTIPLS